MVPSQKAGRHILNIGFQAPLRFSNLSGVVLMKQIESNLVIEWYIDLEDRLRQFLRTVPINWNHRAVLPLLSGIITEAGGIVDSIFRREFDLSDTRAKRHNLRINDFRDHYEKRFSLSSKKTIIYQHPPVLLSPFRGWALPSNIKESELEWWDAYNKIKHERIEHYSKCTLSNAVSALCALHQVLSVLPFFFKSLIAHDMIRLRGYAIPYAIDCIEQEREDMPFLLESQLFATPYGNIRFPDNLENISGSVFGGSKRLEQFVGK